MRLPAFARLDLVRFTVVIVGGLTIDLSVAFLLTELAQLPLTVSATIGFLAGALFNYILHELWTFKAANATVSPVRAALYLASSFITLCVRLVTISLFEPFAAGPLSRLAVLVTATGVSFIANFLLSRFVIFRRTSGGQ